MNFIRKFIAKRAAKALVASGAVFLVTALRGLDVEVPLEVETWILELLGTLAAVGLTYAGVYRVPNEET